MAGQEGPNRIRAAAPYIGAVAAVGVIAGTAFVLNSNSIPGEPNLDDQRMVAIEAPDETFAQRVAAGDPPPPPGSGLMDPSKRQELEQRAAAADPQVPQPGSSVPAVAQAPATVTRPGAAAPQVGMEIVVKFKDDAKVKDIIDTFWKDQPSARAKFDALKARRPEFADLKLDRVTYSNELVLVDNSAAPAAQRLPAMRGIAAKLKDVSDISYAEPNMTAHPGGQ